VRLLDCAIVGAGPGGLTAAIYLARYRRTSVVFDAGHSRAKWIPESHNCPGFPTGISGRDYLSLLGEQAAAFGASVERQQVAGVRREQGRFVLEASSGPLAARSLILATGCEDRLPAVPGLEAAVRCGAVRFCPICDAFETIDRDIAVYGPFESAASHALFMRTYSRRVTIVPTDDPPVDSPLRAQMRDAGVGVSAIAQGIAFDGTRCAFTIDGQARAYDIVYPMLGSRQRSELALSLGADCDEEGALIVSPHQMTSVPGLYAVGDVVSALNQIAVATGHAAIAATAVHNGLPRNFA
jgi:thioredoxin reductase (NADPH)